MRAEYKQPAYEKWPPQTTFIPTTPLPGIAQSSDDTSPQKRGQDSPHEDEDDNDDEPSDDLPLRLLKSLVEDFPAATRAVSRLDETNEFVIVITHTLINEMRGRVPDATIDRMVVANILGFVENPDDFKDVCDERTREIRDEFNVLSEDDTTQDALKKVSWFSREAKALYLCNTIADITLTATHCKESPELLPPKAYYDQQAQFLRDIATVSEMDEALLNYAVIAFNKLSIAGGSPVALIWNNDGSLQQVIKKDPPKKRPKPQTPQP
jgi:hypothetical protein